MIEVRNLTKKYGDHAAVDNLSFTVEDGTIYGFLGPNGAGKSTTMNMMTGYLAPTSGDVLINGHDIFEEPLEAKKTIGYLPEIPPVYPDMTVREYLAFCAELKKVPKAERKEQIEEAAEELALGEVMDRLIRNLSKGYRQRVGFAQALLGNPETLILDEPTVGLDPKQIIEIRDLIRKLGQKHTVILSSHILSEVAEVCDQILIINEGKLVACDTPENLQKDTGEKSVLHVTVEGSPDAVTTALAALPEAAGASFDDSRDGKTEISITMPENEDIRGKVGQTLFAAGLMVLEMQVEKASLENIFLELTEKPGDVAETEAESEDVREVADQALADAGIVTHREGFDEDESEYEDEENPADEPEASENRASDDKGEVNE